MSEIRVPVPDAFYDLSFQIALRALARAVVRHINSGKIPPAASSENPAVDLLTVGLWNDDPKRRHAEVVAVFDDAIEDLAADAGPDRLAAEALAALRIARDDLADRAAWAQGAYERRAAGAGV